MKNIFFNDKVAKQDLLLALDLDGTILKEDGSLSSEVLVPLKKVIEKKVNVCIATGRFYQSAAKFAEKYDFKVPLICANGAIIARDFLSTEFYKVYLEKIEANKILNKAMELELEVYVFTDNNLYLNHFTKEALGKAEEYDKKPIEIEKITDYANIIKICVLGKREIMRAFEQWTTKMISSINLIASDPYSFDITHCRASKGDGVKIIAQYLQIQKENIISVGNYYNDIKMFKASGIGIAVANSPTEVKQEADFVIDSNEKNGVKEVLKKLI